MKFIKKSLIHTCIFFTVLTALFSLAMLLANVGTDVLSLHPGRIICFIPFCLCFAVANNIMPLEDMDGLVKWLLHMVLTVLGAFFFIILPADMDGNLPFMGLIFVIVIYVIAAVLFSLFRRRLKRTVEEDRLLREQADKKAKRKNR